MEKGELQRHFEKIMAAQMNERISVIASAKLKLQLKMLLGISKIFEKVDIKEVFKLYEERGGDKRDIEAFLRR